MVRKRIWKVVAYISDDITENYATYYIIAEDSSEVKMEMNKIIVEGEKLAKGYAKENNEEYQSSNECIKSIEYLFTLDN